MKRAKKMNVQEMVKDMMEDVSDNERKQIASEESSSDVEDVLKAVHKFQEEEVERALEEEGEEFASDLRSSQKIGNSIIALTVRAGAKSNLPSPHLVSVLVNAAANIAGALAPKGDLEVCASITTQFMEAMTQTNGSRTNHSYMKKQLQALAEDENGLMATMCSASQVMNHLVEKEFEDLVKKMTDEDEGEEIARAMNELKNLKGKSN